jgi:hypothetical protein
MTIDRIQAKAITPHIRRCFFFLVPYSNRVNYVFSYSLVSYIQSGILQKKLHYYAQELKDDKLQSRRLR